MEQLKTGHFFGQTNRRLQFDGLTITDTEYTHERVDWHYHEKPYFTFILQGRVLEANRKETYECAAGSLLFHNWDNAHYNLKPPGFTRGFHIELEQDWLQALDFSIDNMQGSIAVKNPEIKLLFYKLFQESRIYDDSSRLSMETTLIEVLNSMQKADSSQLNSTPSWIKPLKEILHDRPGDNLSLSQLSQILGIHPVHLSRYFPKYFGCSLGEYSRKLKVGKSLGLLLNPESQLVDIALEAGFSDQSHFNRCFKENMGLTPQLYRKQINN